MDEYDPSMDEGLESPYFQALVLDRKQLIVADRLRCIRNSVKGRHR